MSAGLTEQPCIFLSHDIALLNFDFRECGERRLSTLAAIMSSEEAAKAIADGFTGRTVLVHIPDGRAFRGMFVCVDSDVNIILANTDEVSTAPNGSTSSRNVGMVMVPGEFLVKIEVQQSTAPPKALHSSSAGWPDDEALYT